MTTTQHTMALCPVGEVAIDRHYYVVGTGKVVEWHIMGDSRTEVEVCSMCARCDEETHQL